MLLQITVPAQKVGLHQVGRFTLTARVTTAVTYDGSALHVYALEMPPSFSIQEFFDIWKAELVYMSGKPLLAIGFKEGENLYASVHLEVSGVAQVADFESKPFPWSLP